MATPPIDACGDVLSGTYANGKLLVTSAPDVPSAGIYEQLIQVSNDGGATWISPASYSGLPTFFPSDPGVETTQEFATVSKPGTMIRNCMQVIGSGNPTYDTKTLPVPTIFASPGQLAFSNGAADTNANYLPAEDEYTITLVCYDSSGNHVNTVTLPPYKPAQSAPNLAGLPPLVAAKVSVGPDNYTLNATANVQATLAIKHTYDALGTNQDTTLSASANSFTCSLKSTTLVGGNSIAISPSDIVGSSVTPFEVVICNAAGAALITFSEPHNNVAQNFPANGLSNYPLLGGTYYPKLKTGGTTKPMKPFKVEPWTICDKFVTMNYNGLTSGGTFKYSLPIEPGATTLETQFSSFTVPDRYIVTDCTGAVMYDSGNVSVTDQRYNVPTAGFNIACGSVDVEIIPNPGPAGQVTIYSLAVGCCKPKNPVDLPKRDPFFDAYPLDAIGCQYGVVVYAPYTHLNGNYCIRTGLVDACLGGGCLYGFEDTVGTYSYSSFNCIPADTQFAIGGCFNFPVAATRTITRVGDKVCVGGFSNTAMYQMAVDFFQNVLANMPNNDYQEIVFYNVKNVNCGDDGVYIGNFAIYLNSSIITFDSVAEKITVDYTGYSLSGSGSGCCPSASIDSESAINAFLTGFPQVGQVGSIYMYTLNKALNTSIAQVSPGIYQSIYNIGIVQSACNHSNPPEPYTLVIDKNQTPTVVSLYRGAGTFGQLIQQSPTSIGIGDAYSDKCKKFISLVNADGLVVQDVDFATKQFDMTFYGGGAAETFADGAAMAARLSVLTGDIVEHIPTLNLFKKTPDSLVNLKGITCK